MGVSEHERALRAGGLAILPTDTVYGIGCAAGHRDACARLYACKSRGRDQPTAVVLGSPRDLGTQVGSGTLIALLGGMLAGGALATASELRRSESASLVTIWFMAVGALLTAPSFAGGAPGWSAPLALALAGVVVTSASGQWLLHHGLGFVSATTGSLAAATGVLTTAILEGLLLGQHLSPRVIAGGLLMLAAVGLAGRAHPPAVADEAIAD